MRLTPNGRIIAAATVVLLRDTGADAWRLDMQVPERQVAEAQLAMLRAAQLVG